MDFFGSQFTLMLHFPLIWFTAGVLGLRLLAQTIFICDVTIEKLFQEISKIPKMKQKHTKVTIFQQ